MRVLWISHSAQIGGAELGLVEGVHALSRRGHSSHVVLPADGELGSRLNEAKVDVIPHNPWAGGRRTLAAQARGFAYDLLVARKRIADLAARTKADIVVSSTISVAVGGPGARAAGVPHVWKLSELAPEHGLRFYLGPRLTFSAMRRYAAGFLVISDATRKWYADSLPRERLRVIDYAVEMPDVATEERAAADPFRIILVGHKTRAKGQHEAIDAVAHAVSKGMDIELTLLGGSESGYESQLRERATRLRIDRRVRFLGFEANPANLVAKSDVALTCSRWEAFGRTTVEAMKLGRPVIGAALGGTVELIQDGWNGLLYEPGDTTELAGCIERLYRDREFARRMGDRGQAWACQRFTVSRHGAQLEQALEDFASAGSANAAR